MHLVEEGLEPHKVDELYFFGTRDPNVKFDISDVIEEKIRCLKSHKSQFNGQMLEIVEEYVRKWSREAAKDRDFEFAEAFRKISFPI